MRTPPSLSAFSPVPLARIQSDLAAIEERAGRINSSLARAAKQARVSQTSLSKWRNGHTAVIGTTFGQSLDRLAAALAAEERALLAYLKRAVR